MAADSIEVTSAGPALGEITSRGRLLKRDGTPLARFEQTLRLWKGSRVLLFDVTLDPQAEPRADPWNSYYAARFAWNDATADTFRSVALTSQPTELKRMEAPHFVHLRGEKTSTTILTAGLPYHKRTGIRVLDSLLVVRGERARRFRFGVGIDLKYPLPAALAMLAPQTHVVQSERPPSAGAASWLVHLGAKNACATHWEPLVENGRVVGVRARILETEGRPSRCRFRSFRPLVSARHVDFLGATLAELKIDEGAALVELAKYEWVEVEARWSS